MVFSTSSPSYCCHVVNCKRGNNHSASNNDLFLSHKNLIDPSTVFSTFDMDQLGKIRRHHWKDCLKISKLAEFYDRYVLASEDIASQSCRVVVVGGWGASFVPPPSPTIQTSIKFGNFDELYLR